MHRKAKLVSSGCSGGSTGKQSLSPLGVGVENPPGISSPFNIFAGLNLPLPDLPVLGFQPLISNPSASLKHDRLSNHGTIAVETRNQWFIQPGLVPEYNKTASNQQEERPSLDSGSYMIFFISMICIDILMLLHRMIKAVGTGKLLLYGYPIYVDARDQKSKSCLMSVKGTTCRTQK